MWQCKHYQAQFCFALTRKLLLIHAYNTMFKHDKGLNTLFDGTFHLCMKNELLVNNDFLSFQGKTGNTDKSIILYLFPSCKMGKKSRFLQVEKTSWIFFLYLFWYWFLSEHIRCRPLYTIIYGVHEIFWRYNWTLLPTSPYQETNTKVKKIRGEIIWKQFKTIYI